MPGSPIDDDGHGTHTAAGTFVKGANAYGNANGTAVGVAPLTHLAIVTRHGVEGSKESCSFKLRTCRMYQNSRK